MVFGGEHGRKEKPTERLTRRIEASRKITAITWWGLAFH